MTPSLKSLKGSNQCQDDCTGENFVRKRAVSQIDRKQWGTKRDLLHFYMHICHLQQSYFPPTRSIREVVSTLDSTNPKFTLHSALSDYIAHSISPCDKDFVSPSVSMHYSTMVPFSVFFFGSDFGLGYCLQSATNSTTP